MFMKDVVGGFFEKYKISSGQVPDLPKILKLCGIDLEKKELKDSGASGVLVFRDGAFKIIVNSSDSDVRQRYTIAHELGHFYLHAKNIDVMSNESDEEFFRGQVHDSKEREANQFAAELLMPEDLFREQFLRQHKDIESLARYFGVSQSACAYRIKNLNLR